MQAILRELKETWWAKQEQSTLNKRFSLKFPDCYLDWQIPDKGLRVQWPKCWDISNKDEDNSTDVNNLNKEYWQKAKELLKWFLLILTFIDYQPKTRSLLENDDTS